MNSNITKRNLHNQSDIQVNENKKRTFRKDSIGKKAIWEPIGVITGRLFCSAVYLMLWAATSMHVVFGSIEGVSSLGFAPPSTEMGKKSSPALTDSQVNSTGAFHYSIPLKFPAGLNDMKPLISVKYSSDAPLRGSVLGAGWQLSIPMITGDTSRPSVDKSGDNLSRTHFVSTFMGGGKLIRQSNSPVAGNDVEIYFALHDNQSVRYERHIDPGPEEGRWHVRPGDGFVYEFGYSSDHHQDYRAPLIRQTHEVSGAVIEYEWSRLGFQYPAGAPAAFELRLNRVIYKTSRAAPTPFAEVSFTYWSQEVCTNHELPVGARLDYHYGGSPQIYGTQGLRSISIRARRPEADGNDGLVLGQNLKDVRKYEFIYSDETSSCDFNLGAPLRRLDQVQETAYAPVSGEATPLPPVQFAYGEFEPAKTRIYEEREFVNLTLARGKDVNFWYRQEPAVSRALADINGDGYEDLVVREVGSTDSNNRVYVYYNIDGTGFSATAKSFSFPQWLRKEYSQEIPEGWLYEDISLGLSGQIKFYADFTYGILEEHCGAAMANIRIGSKESFGFYDVNHDGLLDAVTELEYDPRWVNGNSMGFPPPEGSSGGYSTFVFDDNDLLDPCAPGMPHQRERWPVWRVRYNLGDRFADSVVEVDAPTVLPSVSPRGSMSGRYGSGVRTHHRNFQGDLNGDGLGDILDRAKLDPGQSKAEFAYNSKGFFVPGIIDDPSKYGAPQNTRWMVVGENDGFLYRVPVYSFGWFLPDTMEDFLSASFEDNLGNGSYQYKTLIGVSDINGDSLGDLVVRDVGTSDWRLKYFPNNGRRWLDNGILLGRAGDQNPVDYLGMSGSYVAEKDAHTNPTQGYNHSFLFQEDINSDGLVDMVRLGNDSQIQVYANNGLRFPPGPTVLTLANDDDSKSMTKKFMSALFNTTYMGAAPDDLKEWRKTRGYIDLTGDGLKDIVEWNASNNRYKLYVALEDQANWATHPPYLLNSISNGQGMQMAIDYASTGDADTVTQGELDGNWHSIRSPRWVVKSIDVQPNYGVNMRTSYTYHYPVYTHDYYGKYELRGFKERVKTTPSGMQVVDRYDYDQHYAGLHKEQVTYQAENPDDPHKIVEKSYIDYAPVHDTTDKGMISFPRNWYEAEQVTTTCPDGPSNITDGEAHCIANGDSLIKKTGWVSLNYQGDGITTSVPTLVVPEKETVIFADGHGRERKLITTKQFEIRADADEYLVREKMAVTKDYSQNPARIISHTSNHWNNRLRELGLQSEYVYEDNVQVATKVTRYEYDDRGLVTQKREPKEYAVGGYAGTRFEYDELGLTVTKETNPLGHVIRSITDIGTAVTLLIRSPNRTINANDHEVYEQRRVVVDGLGRILEKYISADDADQGYREVLVEKNTYNDAVANYNGVYGTRVTTESLIDNDVFTESTTVFDGLRRELYTEQVSAETANAETHYHWDDTGYLTKIDVADPSTEGQQVSYHFSYDSLGRQTQVIGPNGEVLSTTRYEGLTQIVSEIGEANAPAAEKRLTNNAADQLIKVEEKLDDGSFAITTYQYDGAGNMETITDPEGVTTLMMHDTVGRRIAIAAGGQNWEYEYDENDNLTAVINPHPEGQADAYTTRMEYDLLNRMTRRIPASADLSVSEKAEFAWGEVVNVYDEPHPSMGESSLNYVGRLGYSTSSIVTNMFRYNAQGQTTEHRQILNVEGLGEASDVELVNSESYYDNGQLQLNSLRDTTANQSLVTPMHHEYDSRGLPMRISGESEVARLVRNHAGLVTQRRTFVAGNHVVANTTYDNLGRITFVGAIQSPSGERSFNQWYTYYANGMVKKIQEKPADGEFRVISYIWDTRHQVKQAFQSTGEPGYSALFDYDRAGRLTYANVGLVSTDPFVLEKTRVHQRDVRYVYDEVDPQRVDQLLHNGDDSTYADYEYDRAGNIIQRDVNDVTWQLRYDGENRLRKVTNMTDGTSEIYYYDGSDRILAVRKRGNTTDKVRRWFAGGEIQYRNGMRDKNWYYVKLGQTVARIENGTEIEYLFQTPQGHQALSMKADGTVNSGKLYGPFGEVLYSELAGDKSPEEYTREFNGKDYDRVSGLHYYGYRYYDPVAIMWNRADPAYRFTPDNGYAEPRRANLYSYTGNNPISLLDPDGLDLERVEKWLARNSDANRKQIHKVIEKTKAAPGGYNELRASVQKKTPGEFMISFASPTSHGHHPKYGRSLRAIAPLFAPGLYQFPDNEKFPRHQIAETEIIVDEVLRDRLKNANKRSKSKKQLTAQAAENIARIAVEWQANFLEYRKKDEAAVGLLMGCLGNKACEALMERNFEEDYKNYKEKKDELEREMDVWLTDRD